MKINSIEELMQKELTRKEFLKHAGLIVLGAIGLPSVIKMLSSKDSAKLVSSDNSNPQSYNSGAYSGVSKKKYY